MSATIWIACAQCGEPIALRTEQKEQLKRSSSNFYCLWGHANHYPQGLSEADKLRQERDRLKQETARLEEQAALQRKWRLQAEEGKAAAERRASAARGQVTKLKKRAAAGVCPCCNRQFVDLQRHMAGKHPTFLAEAIEEGATVQ